MSPSVNIEPHDFVSTINYHPPTEGTIDQPKLAIKTFGQTDDDSRETHINDVRGREHEFSLHDNGFIFTNIEEKGTCEDYLNPEWVKSVYYKQIVDLVKKVTGCDHVDVTSHVNRSAARDPEERNIGADKLKHADQNGPTSHAHTDYCSESMDVYPKLMMNGLPAELQERWKNASRWAIYGGWKPRKTITRDPLLVCDAQTVSDKDFMHCERIYKGEFKLGTYKIAYPTNPDKPHKWYYQHKMQTDEIVIFAGTDTNRDHAGWRCAHAAAVNPEYVNDPPRESIEIRCLAIWE